MMFASLLFFFCARDGKIGFYEGILFISILASFSFWLVWNSRREGKELYTSEELESMAEHNPLYKDIFYLVIGMVALYFGADWLIEGVINIARTHYISEKFISVTAVAFGTSIPELVTSAVAAYKKETDISIGNLIGSNVFNILAILGITALAQPIRISDSINSFDVYYMLGIALAVFPLMYFGRKINRIKGVVLLLMYFSYVYFAFLSEF
jgi:cation:H+ antiporter